MRIGGGRITEPHGPDGHGHLDPSSLQRMLYDTLDHSDDIVLVLEQTTDDAADLGFALANDAFCRISGYTHEDLIGRPYQTLVADDAGRPPAGAGSSAPHRRKVSLALGIWTATQEWLKFLARAAPDAAGTPKRTRSRKGVPGKARHASSPRSTNPSVFVDNRPHRGVGDATIATDAVRRSAAHC